MFSLDDFSNFVKMLMEICCLVNFKCYYLGSFKWRVFLESVDLGILFIMFVEVVLSLENIFDDFSECFFEEMNVIE